jgi:hypothetical protein
VGDDLIAWCVEFGYEPTDTPARWFTAWTDHRETWYDEYADVIAAGVSRAFEEDP